jgi:hypothetical protein
MENAIFLSLITTRSTQEASMLWKMYSTFSKLDISQTWKSKLHIIVCDLVVCCMYILQYINQILWNRWWTNPQCITRELAIQTYVIPQKWHLHWRHCISRRKQIDGEYFILNVIVGWKMSSENWCVEIKKYLGC